MLDGIQVLLMTTGHQAMDQRIYDKEACSLSAVGASVIVIGKHTGQEPLNCVRIVKLPSSQNRIKRFLYQPWHCYYLASRYHSDIFHIQDAELLQIVPLVRLIRPNVKIIYDVHEDFSNLIKIRSYIPEVLKPFIHRIVNVMEKGLSRLVHGVIGVTQPLTDCFSQSKRITVRNFPSRRFYKYAKRVAKPVSQRKYDLIHLGTLSEQRAEFLADMLHMLHQQRPKMRTLITGVHPHIFNKLKHHIPPGCELEGQIPYDQVALRLGNALIGLDVHPFPGDHLNVAVPVKVFEYMACGCAVVTSQIPVLNDLLASCGISSTDITTINGGTQETFVKAISIMHDRVKNGDKIGTRLQKIANQNFIWEREAEKLANFYIELLKC
jgi:glycosyltransferase involved in cell wall biosynthesis